jgi:ABC-type taurine transport system substrate-binding protein
LPVSTYTTASGRSWIVNPDFAKQQPGVVKHWVVAYMRGMRDYYHLLHKKQGDPTPVIQSLVSRTGLKDSKMYTVIGLSGADPNMSTDLTAWNAFQDYFIKLGQQQQKDDLNK